jgi:hypothetical protein
MKSEYKIAWQKYEDVVEKQFSSPIIMNLMKTMMNGQNHDNDEADEDSEDNKYSFAFEEEENEEDINHAKNLVMMPMSEDMLKELSILTNFDCWLAHTNFDITHGIKNKLNKIPGVEVLKIFSRYRFFIAVGKLFDFTEVRTNIENEIIPKEI